MSELSTAPAEIITDPVSHISISGVHGGDELDDRIENATSQGIQPKGLSMGTLLVGAAVGVGIMLALSGLRRRRVPADPMTTP